MIALTQIRKFHLHSLFCFEVTEQERVCVQTEKTLESVKN